MTTIYSTILKKKGYYECSCEWFPIVIYQYLNGVFGKLAMNSCWILRKGFLKISQFLFTYPYESSSDAIWIKIIHHISIHNGSLESKRYIFLVISMMDRSYERIWDSFMQFPLTRPLSQMLLHLRNSII